MNTPKSERLHICFLGRTNVGKSSIINFISNQDISIVSDIAGTTTDIVEKTMELGPIGPVVLVDTAGMDDNTALALERKRKTDKVFDKCEFACLIVEPNVWTQFENSVLEKLKYHNIKFAIIINKIDIDTPKNDFLNQISDNIIQLSALKSDRNQFIAEFCDIIRKELPIHNGINMFDDLINKKELCLFVTPIDSGAPKGRMIMPQIQALRAILDKNAIATFVQVEEYKSMIASLNCLPQLVVTDSQVVKEIIEYSSKQQLITTFSILLARMKGDFKTEIHSVKSLENIKPNDVILIAEACSHHAQKDDIARIKFPKLLEKYLGFNPNIEYCNGGNFPKNLNKYSCIVHCGACMLTQKEKLSRIKIAQSQNVPITNFGIAISFLNGYLDRVLQPFRWNK